MRAHVRLALVLVFGAQVLVQGLACSDDDGGSGQAGRAGQTGSAGAAPIYLDEVIYEGGVTDEAVASVLGVDAQVDNTKAPRLSTPAQGATVDGATPFLFTWAASTAQRGLLRASERGGADRWRLPAWLASERQAHAHGTPFTGVAYLLIFRTAANPTLLVVAAKDTTYTPDAEAWATLEAAGAPITVTLTVARLEQNLLTPGGGPFTSSSGVTFSIP